MVIILGGNSEKNRTWVLRVAKTLAPEDGSVYAHTYSHWVNGTAFINIEHEIKSLGKHKTPTGACIVIAKSMGIILALEGISRGILQPVACLFLGFPLKIIGNQPLPTKELLNFAPKETLFIQNDRDPLGSYDEVKGFLEETGTLTQIRKWSGHTHDYPDMVALKSAFSSLATKQEHR